MSALSKFLLRVGAVSISYLIVRFLRFIYLYTRPSSLERYCRSNDGNPPWALITGASDGIGLGFAHELAHRSFNVVLHGRNATKLEGVKSKLAKKFPKTSFRIVIADALLTGAASEKELSAIVDSLQDINLTVLINNVGGSPPMDMMFRTFHKNPLSDIDNMINLNARFPTIFTAAIIPLLVQNNRPSLIINIGSLADNGTPWTTVYSGAKAFNLIWSKSLSMEMRAEGKDVEVLGISVGQVTSVSHRDNPPSFFGPDARTMAAASLDRVGCGRMVVVGFWTHALQKAFVDFMPQFIVTRLITSMMREQRNNELKRK